MKKILKKIEAAFFELIIMFKRASFEFYLVFFGVLFDLGTGFLYYKTVGTELEEFGCDWYFLGSSVMKLCVVYAAHISAPKLNLVMTKYILIFTSFFVGLYANDVFEELFGNPLESSYLVIAVIFLLAVFKFDEKLSKYIKAKLESKK